MRRWFDTIRRNLSEVAKRSRRQAHNLTIVGSTPTLAISTYACEAELDERPTVNREVVGAGPTAGATRAVGRSVDASGSYPDQRGSTPLPLISLFVSHVPPDATGSRPGCLPGETGSSPVGGVRLGGARGVLREALTLAM